MESWQKLWREGAAPLLTTDNLETLRIALVIDDPRLKQGATTSPPPIQCVQDWPCEAACLLAYCGAADLGGLAPEGNVTVGEVEEYFARLCWEIDQRMGEPAACRYLLNFWDDTPRLTARHKLLTEVHRTLAERLMELEQ